MTRHHLLTVAAVSALLASPIVSAGTAAGQMAHEGTLAPGGHESSAPSATLTVTGLDGTVKTLTLAELMAMPQTTATVTNAHSHQQESYGGVAVTNLLALVTPARSTPVMGAGDTMKSKISSRMTVVIAHGTDNFRVAMTLCDTDPACRSGQSIVADTMDGKPLTTDGAFKLILTEDKTPGRWVRNLDALTMKNLGTM